MALGALETAALERAVQSSALAQQIAAILAGGDPVVTANTAITTVGAGTLTAAGIAGGVITRSGSTAAYTDTTATAALIYAAVGSSEASLGQSWYVTIKNTVAFPQTITGGTGVTVSGISIVPALSATTFLFTLVTTTTATMVGLYSAPLTAMTPEVNTAISTVGAGTLTAAGITGKLITRTGSTAAYTDTTDTAANIIAAMPNANVGDSFEFTIKNMVAFTETLSAASGVTLAGLSAIPPLSVGRFLCVVTAAATVTITGISTVPLCNLPASKFTTTSSASPLTASAGDLTGAAHVNFRVTTNGAFALTTRTATEMFGDIPNAQIGMEYRLTVISQGDNTVTITPGTNVTIDTATVATKVARTYNVKFTSATACTWTTVTKGTVE